MKNFLMMIVFIAQIAITIYLVSVEGWVSGLVFFIFTMMFLGLMVRVGELANQLWRRIFGKD